jgi:capsular polysaccharide biosynthesis protein
MQWPEIAELADVTITPVYPGSNKDRAEFAASQPSSVLEHYRYGKGESVAQIRPITDVEAAGARVVDEPVIYGGLLFRHFGHALAESSHRLWPRFALKRCHAAKVAFSLVNYAKVMPYMTEVLNFHGLSKQDVIRIDEPMCFRQLFVGPQARQMAGPTIIRDYRTLLDDSLSWRLPPPGGERRVYIPRLNYHHSGSYYGESYMARRLASAGYEILFPEQCSLTQLVTALRDSSTAIFAEGSAIHALEFCGSDAPDVLVIARRPNTSQRFAQLLSNVCERWLISEHVLFAAGLSEDQKKHSGVVDLASVMRDIDAFTGTGMIKSATDAQIVEAIMEDVDRLVEGTLVQKAPDDHGKAADLKLDIRQRLRSSR